MPNAIKYNVSAETLALKKGNFWIGTGDVGKGPTNVTGYYNGITPPTGGFTIYLNKESGGPSIYTVTTEAQLVSLTNTIGAQSFTTSSQCLNWFATQTDKMVFNIDYPAIVTNGLVLNVDAGFTPSYPTTGTTWYDVSSSVNNGTLVNGPTFSSAGGGSIVFDGADDYGVTSPTNFTANNDFTYEIWVNSNQYIESRGILSNKGYWQAGGQGAAIGNISNPQYIYGYVTTNTGHFDISSNVGPTYGWTNVIMRRSNNDLRFFINGAQQGSTQTISGTVTDVSDKFWLGSYNNGNTPWLGNMAIARVYNRALTAAEVLQNYNAMKDRFAFIFTVKTDNAGVSTSTQFRMPLISSTGLYFTVNWGDGTPVETITNHTLAIHTYATAGTYTISTVGNLKNWSFNEGGDLLKMLNVFQWAGLEINEFRAFRGCTNLTATATDAPLITTTTLDRFFQNCPNFNGAIGNWNVSGITDMQHMFEGATAFNQPIGSWNVSNVTTMQNMFSLSTAFNQDIGSWNVSNVTTMQNMFSNSTAFNQDIGSWNVSNVTNFVNFMIGKTAANYSPSNLDSLYNGWSQLTLKPNLTIDFGNILYTTAGQAGKDILDNSPNNWTITDGGVLRAETFQFSVKTDNAGVSTSTQFRMPLISSTGLYFTVNWGDGTPVETITNHTLAIHTYATAGTYTISTVGNLRNWAFNEGGDLLKMLNVFQWEGLEINEFRVFRGCTNLTATATDAPLIAAGAFFDRFFQNCPNFNGAIGNWNVSGITDMQHMFEGATAFNQDIGGWNVSNVTNFGSFMAGKTAANYSAANLDSIYNGWSSRAVKPNINITFGSIKYNSTAQSGKNILTGSPNNWTITDGGQL